MNIVTIPRELTKKGELVVVPREEFEEFSQWKKTVRIHLDEQWFWTPEWQKKELEADEAIRERKTNGPFSDHKKLIASLRGRGK